MLTKAITALSIFTKTGLDYFEQQTIDKLNEIAKNLQEYAEEVGKHGKK